MYYGARGIVGLVKPTYRPGSMESFIKLMPEGVGFIPAHAGIRAGNEKELQEALTVAEKKVARLAELGADVVMIMVAPPTMVRGHGADRALTCREQRIAKSTPRHACHRISHSRRGPSCVRWVRLLLDTRTRGGARCGGAPPRRPWATSRGRESGSLRPAPGPPARLCREYASR